MKRGAPQHRKTKRLARALTIPHYAAVGLLECLFHLAASQAQDGNLGRFTDDEIATELGWDRAPEELVAALAECGWLDRCVCHRLRVHDWRDHCDQTVKRVLANNNSMFLACYDDASTMLAPSQHHPSPPIPIPMSSPMSSPMPSPASSQHDARKKPAAVAAAKRPARVSKQKTPAPDDLTPEQKRELLDWVRAPVSRGGLDRADLAGKAKLRSLVSACLDHHRAKGNVHADWLATCRTWVRNEAEGRFAPARGQQPERVTAKVPETFTPPREPGVDYDREREEIQRLYREQQKEPMQ